MDQSSRRSAIVADFPLGRQRRMLQPSQRPTSQTASAAAAATQHGPTVWPAAVPRPRARPHRPLPGAGRPARGVRPRTPATGCRPATARSPCRKGAPARGVKVARASRPIRGTRAVSSGAVCAHKGSPHTRSSDGQQTPQPVERHVTGCVADRDAAERLAVRSVPVPEHPHLAARIRCPYQLASPGCALGQEEGVGGVVKRGEQACGRDLPQLNFP
jgi:hypothetical protein